MSNLSFKLINHDSVEVVSLNITNAIKLFFDSEFNQKFKDGKAAVGLPDFISGLGGLNRFLKINNLSVDVDDDLAEFIKNFPSYSKALQSEPISKENLLNRLDEVHFKRKLTENQIDNLLRLCPLRAAASFSVPGAGKTTEALAFYSYHQENKFSKLLVISPLNAFSSWDHEIVQCLGPGNAVCRIRGTVNQISTSLRDNPRFMAINYESLRSPEKFLLIRNLITEHKDLMVILDESHRAKGEATAEVLLELAPYIQKKLILTGTPMPQAPSDLVSQFSFLYPQEYVPMAEELIYKFEPLYVRTTKNHLGLMPPIVVPHKIDPYPAFDAFYRNNFVKDLLPGVTLEEMFEVNSFRKAVLKWIMLLSNPMLKIKEIFTIDPNLALEIEDEGNGAKFDAVVSKAKELIREGEKVLIWSSFVRNVELLAEEFGDQAVFIHGQVDADQSDKEEYIDFATRESRVKRFKEDPSCMVLIANPGAAAESISLHEQCNHALYLDRTYNAGQFMQSRDRIHRLIEKDKEQQKYFHIFYLSYPGSVDHKVHNALNRKITAMSDFLNDPSLTSLEGFDFDADYLNQINPVDSKDEANFYSAIDDQVFDTDDQED
jgi:SNF2 family DNA or RNA helicase